VFALRLGRENLLLDINWMTRHPDGDLLKTHSNAFSEHTKKLPVFLGILDVNENAH
jgi:hypothetical protein